MSSFQTGQVLVMKDTIYGISVRFVVEKKGSAGQCFTLAKPNDPYHRLNISQDEKIIYQTGTANKGSLFTFVTVDTVSTEKRVESKTKSIPCRHYKTGSCIHGDKCRYGHQDVSTDGKHTDIEINEMNKNRNTKSNMTNTIPRGQLYRIQSMLTTSNTSNNIPESTQNNQYLYICINNAGTITAAPSPPISKYPSLSSEFTITVDTKNVNHCNEKSVTITNEKISSNIPTRNPGQILNTDISKFIKDGYIQLSNVVGIEQIDRCLRRLNRALGIPGTITPGGTQGNGIGKFEGGLSNCEEIKGLLDKNVKSVVNNLLGVNRCDYTNASGQIAFIFPEVYSRDESFIDVNEFRWHTDGLRQGKAHPFSLLLGICLSDVSTELAGNLMVWPGSHTVLHRLKEGPFGDINAAKLKLYMNPETADMNPEGVKIKGGESPPSTAASLLLRAALNIDKSKDVPSDSHVDTSAKSTNSSTHPNPSANPSTHTSRSTNPNPKSSSNPSTNSNTDPKVVFSPELYDNMIKAYNITKNPKTNAAMLSRFSEVLKKIDTNFHYKNYGYGSFKLFVQENLTNFETFSIASDYYLKLKNDNSFVKINDNDNMIERDIDKNTTQNHIKSELDTNKLSISLLNNIHKAFDMTYMDTINMAPLSRFSEELKKMDRTFHYKDFDCLSFKAFVKKYLFSEYIIEEKRSLAYIKMRNQGSGGGDSDNIGRDGKNVSVSYVVDNQENSHDSPENSESKYKDSEGNSTNIREISNCNGNFSVEAWNQVITNNNNITNNIKFESNDDIKEEIEKGARVTSSPAISSKKGGKEIAPYHNNEPILPSLGPPSQLHAKIGDVFILHPDTAHSGGLNNSSKIRKMVYFRLKIKSRNWDDVTLANSTDMWSDFEMSCQG